LRCDAAYEERDGHIFPVVEVPAGLGRMPKSESDPLLPRRRRSRLVAPFDEGFAGTAAHANRPTGSPLNCRGMRGADHQNTPTNNKEDDDMRAITQEDAERWTSLANEHGYVTDDGNILIGRYTIEEGLRSDSMSIRVIIPIIAGPYTDLLERKTPPIMFDRTDDGRIVLPGRWWQRLFEKVSEDESVDDDLAAYAAAASRQLVFEDVYLPADFETISFLAALVDSDGDEPVQHEAIPPDTILRVVVHR
jgi:hypothetical protein